MAHIYDILYDKYIGDKSVSINWNNIEQLDKNNLIDYNNLATVDDTIKTHCIDKVAVIKLNGGLGTTLGCNGPKSLMNIHNNYNFMDIIINQSKLHNAPLILMNSFYTHSQINIYLANNNITDVTSFVQNKYPRILKQNKLPLDMDPNNMDYFYPPGHGDLFVCLQESGILDELEKKQIKYIFVSNSDNLGATVDYNILYDIISNNLDCAVELTRKNPMDIKGGTLVKYNDKHIMVELSQCPVGCNKNSINSFEYFNTNNMWIKISAIRELLRKDYMDDIDIVENNKRLKDGRDCVQLEYTIGSFVKFFDNIKCYIVGRDRFIPVKDQKDYDYVRSTQNYTLNKDNWVLKKNEITSL